MVAFASNAVSDGLTAEACSMLLYGRWAGHGMQRACRLTLQYFGIIYSGCARECSKLPGALLSVVACCGGSVQEWLHGLGTDSVLVW